ncbi:MAG: lysophospholipid acyltransferase family protein [bacterium]
MNLADLKNRGEVWPDLVRDLRYSTIPGKATLASRLVPGWATLRYHWGVSTVIRSVAGTAAAGGFGSGDFSRCCHAILSRAESCGGMIEIDGVEHVKNSVPAVFVANHMGSFETLVVGGFILPFGDVTFVLKESLARYPVFKHLVKGINPVTVGRTNPRDDLRAVMTIGVDRLKAGISVVIFPQSTRSAVFDASKFNSLGVKLAGKAGVPIVPLAVKTDFLTPGRILKDFGIVDARKVIRFRFGAPLSVSGRQREVHKETVDFLAGCLEEWNMPVIRAESSDSAGGSAAE